MPNIRIKPINATEWTIVASLARQIWPISFAGILTPEQISNLLERIYNENNLREEMQAGHKFWIGQDEIMPVGYVSAYKKEDTIWLKKLYVLPNRQGSGIGSMLMDTATRSLLPAYKQCLYVNRDNKAAQHYYMRKGFILTDELPVKMGDFDFVDFVYSRSFHSVGSS